MKAICWPGYTNATCLASLSKSDAVLTPKSFCLGSYAWVNSWSNHPPPGTPPGICLIDSSRGSGICLSSFHVRARGPGIVIVAKDPGDLTNGCPESHPQILRQQNLVSGTQVSALIEWSYFAPSWSRWRKIYLSE